MLICVCVRSHSFLLRLLLIRKKHRSGGCGDEPNTFLARLLQYLETPQSVKAVGQAKNVDILISMFLFYMQVSQESALSNAP